jgi:uncharacterized PE-PGRS family protein PE_PGRS54
MELKKLYFSIVTVAFLSGVCIAANGGNGGDATETGNGRNGGNASGYGNGGNGRNGGLKGGNGGNAGRLGGRPGKGGLSRPWKQTGKAWAHI